MIPNSRLVDLCRHPKQVTLYPGSTLYEVARHMLTNRLSSQGALWYTNVSPMVDKHGAKAVLRAINSLRKTHKIDIRKPTNHHFDRRHVWQISNPERIRFHTPPERES